MKQKSIRLAQRYLTALRAHLEQGRQASLKPALRLGRQTMALGLETLDLARIHEQALITLLVPGCLTGAKAAKTKRAGIFFAEANTPIEATRRIVPRTEADLIQMKAALALRTKELAAANRELQRGVVRRKTMEDAYAKRRELHNKCLEESLQLQKRLRQLTHRLLATQEDERKSTSRELQNEIAQTLVGINIRLLSLKQEARSSTKRFKKGIATTQRLVVRSAESVRRVARKFVPHASQAPDLVAPLPNRPADASKAKRSGKPGGSTGIGQ